eukprot:scaffold625_cov324-Pavlova_lutheri.AAC.41
MKPWRWRLGTAQKDETGGWTDSTNQRVIKHRVGERATREQAIEVWMEKSQGCERMRWTKHCVGDRDVCRSPNGISRHSSLGLPNVSMSTVSSDLRF